MITRRPSCPQPQAPAFTPRWPVQHARASVLCVRRRAYLHKLCNSTLALHVACISRLHLTPCSTLSLSRMPRVCCTYSKPSHNTCVNPSTVSYTTGRLCSEQCNRYQPTFRAPPCPGYRWNGSQYRAMSFQEKYLRSISSDRWWCKFNADIHSLIAITNRNMFWGVVGIRC